MYLVVLIACVHHKPQQNKVHVLIKLVFMLFFDIEMVPNVVQSLFKVTNVLNFVEKYPPKYL